MSSLSSALIEFDQAQNPPDAEENKKMLQNLLPVIEEMKVILDKGDIVEANSHYQVLLNRWTEVEQIVRDESVASYGEIEKYMAFVRIAITKEPIDQEQAIDNLNKLQLSFDM